MKFTQKPRYPAEWFHRRLQYPEKYCNGCGKRLVPKIKTDGMTVWLELPSEFKTRKNCDTKCAYLSRRDQPSQSNLMKRAKAAAENQAPKGIKPELFELAREFSEKWGVKMPYQITSANQEALEEWCKLTEGLKR